MFGEDWESLCKRRGKKCVGNRVNRKNGSHTAAHTTSSASGDIFGSTCCSAFWPLKQSVAWRYHSKTKEALELSFSNATGRLLVTSKRSRRVATPHDVQTIDPFCSCGLRMRAANAQAARLAAQRLRGDLELHAASPAARVAVFGVAATGCCHGKKRAAHDAETPTL